jgi:hypothetical protein
MCNGLNATAEQENGEMVNQVPKSLRRFNSAAVAKRDAWRVRYQILAAEIRMTKDTVRRNPFDAAARIRLESLQTMAQLMNLERDVIGMDLRVSAYKWV